MDGQTDGRLALTQALRKQRRLVGTAAQMSIIPHKNTMAHHDKEVSHVRAVARDHSHEQVSLEDGGIRPSTFSLPDLPFTSVSAAPDCNNHRKREKWFRVTWDRTRPWFCSARAHLSILGTRLLKGHRRTTFNAPLP
ncbi:unnamed protein product [Leuciscus chuanchicus]